MAYFFNCNQFNLNFQDDQSLKDYVESKIEDLRCRKEITPTKTLKIYDRANGIYILRIMGVGKNSRIIIQEVNFKDQKELPSTIYFLRDYINQKEYEPKWRMKILPELELGNYLKLFPLDNLELENAITAYNEFHYKPHKAQEEPENSLLEWIEDFTVEQEFSIYETQSWVNYYKSEINETGDEGELFSLVKNIINLETNSLQFNIKNIELQKRNVYKISGETLYIIFEDPKIYSEHNKNKIILLHHGGQLNETIEQYESKLTEVSNKIGLESDIITVDKISKLSYRAYPLTALTERRKWVELEKQSEKSNLALSPEQINLLKEFKFPKFINGQAGSGKSEMLYYLFAEICFRKRFYEFEGSPVYFTENEELLDRAKYDILDKLNNNSYYSDYSALDSEISNYFFSFRNFILEYLVEEPERFDKLKHINFSIFKDKYKNSPLSKTIKQKFPAEISWFIISTFIKGYDNTKELSPEDYNQIPKKDKSSIDEETFRGVYENVWPFYKKLYLEGYWDRLDLVRDVLNRYESIPNSRKFTAIVCDEAQDFTRIELQLLIKLSVYTDYSLVRVNQVPITFAGDPFQTVNPTGFSLKSLKRLFTSELETQLGFTLSTELVEQLNYNYRSSKNIVNLANVIQYFRFKYLETTDLKNPQEARRVGEFPQNLLFQIESSSDELREKLKYNVFITSNNDGEEDKTIEQDEWLTEDLIVKSAARAKGSEYPKVVLYKFGYNFITEFGQECLSNLLKNITETGSSENLSLNHLFKLAFFFNKLYVAITRAKDDLYILDTENGIKYFWNFFTNNETFKQIKEENWRVIDFDNVLRLENTVNLGAEKFEILLKIAKADEEAGITYRDPKKMKDAAKCYKKLGKYIEEGICIAKSYEFEGKLREAGEKYKILKKNEEAANCFFIAKEWSELIVLLNDSNDIKSKIFTFIAKLMNDGSLDLFFLLKNREVISNTLRKREYVGKLSWLKDFNKMLALNLETKCESEKKNVCIEIALILESFDQNDPSIIKAKGFSYYRGEEYFRAIDTWEKLEFYDFEEYYKAKLKTVYDVSNRIIYSDKIQDFDQVIKIYESNLDRNLIKDVIIGEIVQRAYLKKLEFYKAIELNNIASLQTETLFLTLRKDTTDKVNLFIILLADYLKRNNNIKIRDKFTSRSVFDFINEMNFNKSTQTHSELNDNLTISIIQLIACSQNNDNINQNIKQYVYKYLMKKKFHTQKLDFYTITCIAVTSEKILVKIIDLLDFYNSNKGFIFTTQNLNSQTLNREIEKRWLKINFKSARRKVSLIQLDETQKKSVENFYLATVKENLLNFKITLKEYNLNSFTYEELEQIPELPSLDTFLVRSSNRNIENQDTKSSTDNFEEIQDPEKLKEIIRHLRGL